MTVFILLCLLVTIALAWYGASRDRQISTALAAAGAVLILGIVSGVPTGSTLSMLISALAICTAAYGMQARRQATLAAAKLKRRVR
jgi:hypothetical protein